MLNQDQVFSIISKEREYQDKAYNPTEKLSRGLGPTRADRDKDVTAHLVLLDLYLAKAKEAWNVKGDNVPALQQLAKLAAIAVRALERSAASEVLLSEGLR